MFSQQIFLQGLGLGASLIMPIGVQNAHVIRTGIRGRHVLLTVATCIVVDISLIALGMAGFGALVTSSPLLLAASRYGGALALSLLNPHVYLDTVVLLGAVGTSLATSHRPAFTAGAMAASLLWFTGLGLVARLGAGVLKRPAVWRAIEAFTGVTMLVLAGFLLLG